MLKELENFDKLPIWDKIALFERLSIFPALTLMVFTRRGIGFRCLHPVAIVVVVGIMMVLAAWAHASAKPEFLKFHAWLFLVFAILHRIQGWWGFRRGVRRHSFYLGTPAFEFGWMPGFIVRSRLIGRWLEPLVWMFVGIFVYIKGATAEGVWIVFAALCLRTFEEAIHKRNRAREMDLLDGMIVSETQTETVERFSPPVSTSETFMEDAPIPTGLSSELRDKIARRPHVSAATHEVITEGHPRAAAAVEKPLTVWRCLGLLSLCIAVDLLVWVYFVRWYQFKVPPSVWSADLAINVSTYVILRRSLRSDWLFVPILFVELVPLINFGPFWTFCAAGVIVAKRRAANPKRSTWAAAAKFAKKGWISKEAVVTAVLVVPALFYSAKLSYSLLHPDNRQSMTFEHMVVEIQVQAAQNRVDAANARVAKLDEEYHGTPVPGPEPDKRRRFEEWEAWSAKKAARQRAADEYFKNIVDAKSAQVEADVELLREKTGLIKPTLLQKSKMLWTRYAVPPLHAMLAFSLLRFSIKALFRLTLLRERLGEVQIIR